MIIVKFKRNYDTFFQSKSHLIFILNLLHEYFYASYTYSINTKKHIMLYKKRVEFFILNFEK